MRREALSPICGLALLIGGCPKRQAPTRIVYVPSPPQAAAPTSTAVPQAMVIEEPAPPPEPEEEVTPEPAAPAQPPRRRRILRTEPPPAAVETVPETVSPPPAEVPALEPRESSAEESALRRQIQELQEDLRRRLARLPPTRLSPSDRRTLEDARTFFAQSGRALQGGDLQRALNLARKASLLLAALEQTE